MATRFKMSPISVMFHQFLSFMKAWFSFRVCFPWIFSGLLMFHVINLHLRILSLSKCYSPCSSAPHRRVTLGRRCIQRLSLSCIRNDVNNLKRNLRQLQQSGKSRTSADGQETKPKLNFTQMSSVVKTWIADSPHGWRVCQNFINLRDEIFVIWFEHVNYFENMEAFLQFFPDNFW